jgi:short subunit fatty acids transporter
MSGVARKGLHMNVGYTIQNIILKYSTRTTTTNMTFIPTPFIQLFIA